MKNPEYSYWYSTESEAREHSGLGWVVVVEEWTDVEPPWYGVMTASRAYRLVRLDPERYQVVR